MSLVVTRQSWHYRLHVFVRNLWGWTPSPTERWSLCPYFWTIVLGTFFSLLTILFAVLGWVIVRLARKAYKSGSKGGLFSFWTRLCDATIIGRILDESASSFKNAFIPAGLMHLLMLSVVIGCLVGFGFIVYFVFHVLIMGVGQAPHLISAGVMRAGYLLFYTFALVGYVVVNIALNLQSAAIWLWAHIVEAAIWLWNGACSVSVSTWTKLTAASTWISLGKWLLTILSGIILSLLGLVIISIVAAYTIFNDKFWSWAEMKANGYAEARRVRLEKFEAEQQAIECSKSWEDRAQEAISKYEKTKRRSERLDSFLKCIGDFFKTLWKVIVFVPVTIALAFWAILLAVLIFCRNLYAKPVYDMYGRQSKQLGPLGFLVTMLFAFKKRACPLIEFADASDLKDSPHPRPPAPPAAPMQPTP